MLTPESRTIEMIRGRYDPITDTGYMGYVPAREFISGDQLANRLNFHSGSDQNSSCGWLKFYVGPNAICNTTNKQKVLYLAKKSIKHEVSWDDINDAELVYGNTNIKVHGKSYSVRLLTGGKTNNGAGSEWNELLYRVHPCPPDGKTNWTDLDPVFDTNISDGKGKHVWKFIWCQETSSYFETSRIVRGYRVSYWTDRAACFSVTIAGWRPVLEQIY